MKVKSAVSALGRLVFNTKRLLALAWQTDRSLTFWYYTTAAVGSALPVFTNIFLKLVIDNLQLAQGALAPNVPTVIIVVLGAYYLVGVFEDIFYYGFNYSYIDYLFRYKLQNSVSFRFYEKVSDLDVAHFEDTKTQDLITKTRDTMLWRVPDYLRDLRDFFANLVGYISALVVLIPFGIWIPAIITVVTIPRIFLRAKYGALQWSIYGSGAPKARRLWYMGWLLQTPTSIKEMRIFQSTKAMLVKYAGIQEELYQLNKRPLDKFLKVRNFPILIETALLFVISYKFLGPTVAGTITIGTFTLLIGMMSRLNSNAASSASRIGELYENSLYVDNYFDTLELPKLVTEKPEAKALTSTKPPQIEFRNVTFAYPKSKPVIKDFNLTINSGESVAFVGKNGAGKSTLIKLLCRFYDVTEGEILIDGTNITDLKVTDWYKKVGTLFQQFTQYHFTVRENITLGDPDKNDRKEMISAAKKAGADEFIQKLPKKYETMLGREFEDGEELSVGQWQKLAIARSFYEQPQILILDEPTSAIDAEAEYEIFNNLQKQYKDKTLILVSHRFSTVRNAQKIVVIDNGKISEQGTHEELIKKSGKYADMFNKQAEGYQ